MKTLINIAFLIAITSSTFAQLSDQQRTKFENKVESFSRMKKTGSTLGFIGGGLTITGIILVSSADWSEETDIYGNTQYQTNDAGGPLGILALCTGVPLAITGIVLNSVGNRKMKEYSRKLENIDMSYFQHGQQKGVSLSITF